ncbi:MAG: sigma-70 family RNA polymerase sigma factor [Nannocystaceae bacterium]
MPSLSPEQATRVERAAPRVKQIAHAVHRSLWHIPLEELRSAGYEGLVHAALRYDPDSGVPFAAFAYYRIRGAMIDYGRRSTPGSRSVARAQRSLAAQQSILEEAQELHSDQHLTLRDRVAQARQVVARATAVALLARTTDADPETTAARDEDPESSVISTETRHRLHTAVAAMDSVEQDMIHAIYVDGKNMHEYARELGVNASTVSRRHARIVAKLALRLGER